MGAAAAAADVVVVTSDNPRREEPGSMVACVSAGARDAGCASVLVEVDRRAAIARALESAGPDDVVLILGKGHEQGQDLGDRVVPFDDRAVVRNALEAS
jgi:UDP-N-acetylmuramoyl-L-alanyl-D-glutamate--2,6-diaminopimelate ligase